MKKLQTTILAAAAIGFAGVMSSNAQVAYDQNLSFAAGTGNSHGGWTVATGNGLNLGLRAQYNNTTSPVPSDLTPNNGSGTFTFGTGTSTRAVWDFWFDVSPGSTSIAGDSFVVTITSSLGGSPVSIPVLALPDNSYSGTEFQNAEDIGFSFIGYDPSKIATYDFTFTATDSSNKTLDSVNMTVNNGVAPVPEPTTVVAGALMLLPLGIGAVRQFRKARTA